MSFNSRFYIYGISHDNSEDFLTTVLNLEDYYRYVESHTRQFPGRFTKYIFKVLGESYD